MRPGKLLQCIKCGGGSFIWKILLDVYAVRRAQSSALAGESSAYLLDQVLGRSVGQDPLGPARFSSDAVSVLPWLHVYQEGKPLTPLSSSDGKLFSIRAPGPSYGVGLSHPQIV